MTTQTSIACYLKQYILLLLLRRKREDELRSQAENLRRRANDLRRCAKEDRDLAAEVRKEAEMYENIVEQAKYSMAAINKECEENFQKIKGEPEC